MTLPGPIGFSRFSARRLPRLMLIIFDSVLAFRRRRRAWFPSRDDAGNGAFHTSKCRRLIMAMRDAIFSGASSFHTRRHDAARSRCRAR